MRNSWTVRPEEGVQAPSSCQGVGIRIRPAATLNADSLIAVATTDPSREVFAEQLAGEEHDRLRIRHAGVDQDGGKGRSAITSIPPAALMSNWLRRTGWGKTLDGANHHLLVALARLPSGTGRPIQIIDSTGTTVYKSSVRDEQRIASLTKAIDWLMDRCHDTLSHIDVFISR